MQCLFKLVEPKGSVHLLGADCNSRSTLQVFPNLTVRVSEFHMNNGRILNLLKSEGTVPIHYRVSLYQGITACCLCAPWRSTAVYIRLSRGFCSDDVLPCDA